MLLNIVLKKRFNVLLTKWRCTVKDEICGSWSAITTNVRKGHCGIPESLKAFYQVDITGLLARAEMTVWMLANGHTVPAQDGFVSFHLSWGFILSTQVNN